MLARLRLSFTIAFVALLATAAAASAADLSDRDQVMLGMGAFVIGLMIVLTILYAVRHLLGLDKMPPPDPSEAAHGHGHH